jgi:hypothetical protein
VITWEKRKKSSANTTTDTLDENLGLVEIEVEASVLLEYMLGVREHL